MIERAKCPYCKTPGYSDGVRVLPTSVRFRWACPCCRERFQSDLSGLVYRTAATRDRAVCACGSSRTRRRGSGRDGRKRIYCYDCDRLCYATDQTVFVPPGQRRNKS